MDAQSLISIAQLLIGVIFLMVVLNLYLVIRLKDIDPFRNWKPHEINGALFVIFGVVSMIAAGVAYARWSDLMILVKGAASEHGDKIDAMFWRTMYVSLFVTILTNALLFFYSWLYRARPGRKALFYPENIRLEILWTVVPAIVLTALVVDGAFTWNRIFGDPPADAIEIEMYGKQFEWNFRYPGNDQVYGDIGVGYINLATGNTYGFNFEDTKGHDDKVTKELHLPVGVPVNFTIRSMDVLHSATLPHFRMKMDAVPGMPTRFMMTPTITTKEMRERTGNPEFTYEMSCQQICGGAHWNMRREVIVETMEEYQQWLGQQQTYYSQVNPGVETTPNPVLPEPQQLANETEGEEGTISMN